MNEEQVLLLCDVVDSTALTERLGDGRAAAYWSAHDAVARDLLAHWCGREIDKTDGFFALFVTVDDALGFAEAYHQALAALDPPALARAVIHRAPVLVRETPAADVARGAKPLDVDGVAKPLTARLCALALRGQTLVSASAAANLASDVSLNPVGHWQLKGVGEPVALFEPAERALGPPLDAEKAWRVAHDGRRWLPTREILHSLPAERDSFVGRRQALMDLAAAHAGGARLVTVLGIGGSGKTRLVQHHGWDSLGSYSGGVWFCDLSQAVSFDGLVLAVAQGLHLSLGASDPIQQIAASIAQRGRVLVVLDNFEQVARQAEQTLGRWLNRAPAADFLVTSREVLGIAGETVLALPPLSQPEAADLFVLRAKAADKDFKPGASERGVIEQLAGTLDGLPLAIELAAARIRVMDPQALLQRMHRRFDLLMSRGGRPDRQATLRAALDWSWDLLNDEERVALSQLSVFQGGFRLHAAEAVVAVGPDPGGLELLSSLVDKSLVRRLDGARFGLLESVRDYAAIRLRESALQDGDGAGCDALRARHWRYFAGLTERDAVAGRCADLDNLVTACRAACEGQDGPSAVRCLVNAWAALRLTGPYRAAVALAERVAGLPQLSEQDAGLVHWVWGTAQDLLGETEGAREQFVRGMAFTAAAGPCEAAARLSLAVGSQLTLQGDLAQAQSKIQGALDLAVELGDLALEANALNSLGRLMDHQSKAEEARRLYLQALELARETGDSQLEGGLLGNLGGLLFDQGELEGARWHFEQALSAAETGGDRRWLGNACSNLGLLLLEQGQHQQAKARLDQAILLARSTGDLRLASIASCNLGILANACGRPLEAERHLLAAVEGAMQAADRRSEGQFRGYLAVTLARLGRLESARATLELGEQAIAPLVDRLTEALLMCDRAEVEWLCGRVLPARQAHDRARTIAIQLASGVDSELHRRLESLEALINGT